MTTSKLLIIGTVVFMVIAQGVTYFMPGLGSPAEFSAEAAVTYVGPTAATQVEAEFIRTGGELRTLNVRTVDEEVIGQLVGLSECDEQAEADFSETCSVIQQAVAGKFITSHHTSSARLDVASVTTVDGAQLGLAPGPVELVAGSITGTLVGTFAFGDDAPELTGKSTLTIQEGSTATYACFTGPGVAGSLEPCERQLGGQLFPIQLNAVDIGTFEVSRLPEAASETPIRLVSGKVEARVTVPGTAGPADGTIQIIDTVTFIDPQ